MALIDKLTAIADGFRASRATNVKYTLDQMAEMAAETGGGDGAGDFRIKYVTFIGVNGEEPYRMPVVIGDTCQNPVDKGYISAPTKESTVQYDYTYSGWSLTEGGEKDSTALTNVTENRTVYVAFTESARKYTITYYDSDGVTVLKTEEKAYGSTVGYIPNKSGYSFVEWQPSLEIVTGDASYIASWEEKISFAGGAWSDIIEVAESGKAANHFSIGDTRTEQLGDETVTYTIVDFNKDVLSSDTSKTAGMTIVSNVLAQDRSIYDSTVSSNESVNYADTNVCECIQNLYTDLPIILRDSLKYVRKQFVSSGIDYEPYTSSARIWALSVQEVYYSGTTAYSYFSSKAKIIGYKTDGTASAYWLRTGGGGSGSNSWYYVTTSGMSSMSSSLTDAKGVRFGFCI